MALRVRGLTRRPWFEDRALDLEPGEILVLTGPSGSGKTLFLRALADLDPVDAGVVELAGKTRSGFSPSEWRSRVMYLHQIPVRLPGDVHQNIDRIRGLEVHASSSPTGAGTEVPEVPGVPGHSAMEHLSGGEAQRVALHRALCLGPQVLLLDEATGALDEAAARSAEAAVLAWTHAGGAAIWVAHDRGLAARLGAREQELQ